ncbi:Replication factor C subunit 3 [Zancudomyces culisetae]|uniref:Replication factor C subunit 3 n=1 Tax=Zancudomyces culisetae TaxID=1213189 RepID=A0A1R1PW33_ZANCU|nr:Replication factor C subunit 3 [Zancudomyces culisetae]|eukprot:OMH85177.1 Replication factor C subunit 3 [Zancudomyces culisetae]
MRRVLNILQGCHSAYDVIDKDAVYNCTGQPRPEDVQNILDSMLNDEYSVALDYISKIKNNHGLALQDIITSLLEFVNAIDFPDQTRIFIIDKMSDIEYKLGNGASERTQLSALIGAFKVAVELAA